jgi:hypothetical protein
MALESSKGKPRPPLEEKYGLGVNPKADEVFSSAPGTFER